MFFTHHGGEFTINPLVSRHRGLDELRLRRNMKMR